MSDNHVQSRHTGGRQDSGQLAPVTDTSLSSKSPYMGPESMGVAGAQLFPTPWAFSGQVLRLSPLNPNLIPATVLGHVLAELGSCDKHDRLERLGKTCASPQHIPMRSHCTKVKAEGSGSWGLIPEPFPSGPHLNPLACAPAGPPDNPGFPEPWVSVNELRAFLHVRSQCVY